MTGNDRLAQIQRRWHGDVKYRRGGDPETAELHEFVADLLDEIEERDDSDEFGGGCNCDLEECNDLDHLTQTEWEEEARNLERQHIERIGEFAPALEELHAQAHGSGSLYLCTAKPCRGLYRLLPNARGQLLSP